MQSGKHKNELLDYNYYQQVIKNLQSTMTPQEIQQMLKKQQQHLRSQLPQFQPISNIYPYIALTNNFSFNPYQMQPVQVALSTVPTPPIQSNTQQRVLRNSTLKVQAPKPAPTMLAKMISSATQPEPKITPKVVPQIPSKVSSKVASKVPPKDPPKVTDNTAIFQEEEEDQWYVDNKEFNQKFGPTKYVNPKNNSTQAVPQNEQNSDQIGESKSQSQKLQQKSDCVSQLSQQQNLQTKDNASQQSEEGQDEGQTKFFPMEQPQMFFSDDKEEEKIAETREIFKGLIAQGFGLRAFSKYVKEHAPVINPDLFYESKTRYYKRVYDVTKKIVHSIQYFLAKDCGLKIRKISLDEYTFLRKYMIHYKRVFSKKNIKTLEKFIKIILNLEDVTLTERRVSELHQSLLEKLNKKFKREEGINYRVKKLSQIINGAPYTICQVRGLKRNGGFDNDLENEFQKQWTNKIQKEFLHYYKQRISMVYCHEKLTLLYPQFKKFITIYSLKRSLERILRVAFGKLLARIKTIGKQKLPRLSPINSIIFRKIMSMKHYQSARFSLLRIYQEQDLNEENTAFYIRLMNQCLRKFQAIEGLLLIKNIELCKQPEMNIVSLRPRFIVREKLYDEISIQQSEDEKQEQHSKQPQKN